jgi:Kef-type K+ transport system membrane component KefB
MVCHFFFSTTVIQSMFIGLGLSVTAIAVNARVLNDLCLQRYRVTPVIIGASIVDDVLSFALFSAIIELTTTKSHFNWLTMGHDLIKVLIFFGLTILIGIQIFPKLSRYFSDREAKGFTFALIMALLFGLMAEIAGLHIIIGAYMAGLFVREGIVDQELFQKINDRFVSITYGFFGPIFFVSLAFHMNFSIFSSHAGFISLLLFVAVIGKMGGTMIGTWLGKMNFKESMVVSCAMNGRGAVELVIASVGIKLGIIDDVLFSILVVIAFLTTLFPPISLSFLLRKGREGLKLIDPKDKPC